jgi:hypothetical protein
MHILINKMSIKQTQLQVIATRTAVGTVDSAKTLDLGFELM